MKKSRGFYHYKPLDLDLGRIRLLTVLPKNGSTIYMSLQDVLLHEVNGQFDACSYTWSEREPHRHVVVNNKKLLVRDNIWQCLKHMKRPNMLSHPLWIDCICIDQKNADEKAQQVARMSNIFLSARTVFVWLGSTSRRFQPENVKGHALLRDVLHDPTQVGLLEPIFHRQDSIAFEAVDQLMRLVYNEYWHRLWIIQEVVLARRARVILGNFLIEPNTLVGPVIDVTHASKPVYYAWLRRQRDSTFKDRGLGILDHHPMLLMESWHSDLMGDVGLATLIDSHRTQLCTDPRDRIYGFLGLTSSRYSPIIDYKCSVEELLMRTITSIYAESQTVKDDGTSSRFNARIIACIMQGLETNAEKVRAAIGSSTLLLEEYTQQFEVVLQPCRIISTCLCPPSDEGTFKKRCTTIQALSSSPEHFWKRFTWFGPHHGQHFQVEENGALFLVCCIDLFYPTLLLSIDMQSRIRVERFLSFDLFQSTPKPVYYKSRCVPSEMSESLNDKINALDIDWQKVFRGQFFDALFTLSVVELVEIAETWNSQATRYNPSE